VSEDAPRVPAVLSVAGSDSGGGAGIQADLKAFAAAGVHGMTAITALTAQNTVGVETIEPVSPEMIVAQVRAVATDIGVDAVKIGMLGDERTIDAVAEALDLVGEVPVVVDPVMVSESGSVLLEPEARTALVERIVPRASVLTPNLAEARVLAGLGGEATPLELARTILELGPAAVIVTGGHGDGVDLLVEARAGATPVEIPGELHPDGAAHGSGCTHSSTLAAHLARGRTLVDAAAEARMAASRAVRDGLREIGAGAGPVDVLGVEGRSGRPSSVR
jgi:hydroxymethylpyrimidine/phosphomethylpyrimidine kinase